jgi:hypothetical protein
MKATIHCRILVIAAMFDALSPLDATPNRIF